MRKNFSFQVCLVLQHDFQSCLLSWKMLQIQLSLGLNKAPWYIKSTSPLCFCLSTDHLYSSHMTLVMSSGGCPQLAALSCQVVVSTDSFKMWSFVFLRLSKSSPLQLAKMDSCNIRQSWEWYVFHISQFLSVHRDNYNAFWLTGGQLRVCLPIHYFIKLSIFLLLNSERFKKS